MLDIKVVRNDPERVREAIRAKGEKADLDVILELDEKRRSLILEVESLKRKRNEASERISQLKKENEDAKVETEALRDLSRRIKDMDQTIKDAEDQLNELLLAVPNLPHECVPIGGEKDNKEIRRVGELPRLDFEPLSHWDIGESTGVLDFKAASKLSGAGFAVFRAAGAKLQRGLVRFMLDIHTREHGYTEVSPPVLVNAECMTATGQLPKLEEDMYKTSVDELFLIPTAEVPVTNLHRDEILSGSELPICYVSHTQCFRREAGSYGRDTRGLVRVHQFEKVELVRFVRPETSYDELELLLSHAEEILKRLELPYRVMLLASGDLGFAASKCYDIELYSAGLDRWLEVSSCSNFVDFQARRGSIRFRPAKGAKAELVHTLNGSGVALPRLIVAILENCQQQDGSVLLPEALWPYMDGDRVLVAEGS
jgi:seryl-tRNA synthetase